MELGYKVVQQLTVIIKLCLTACSKHVSLFRSLDRQDLVGPGEIVPPRASQFLGVANSTPSAPFICILINPEPLLSSYPLY